MIGHVQSWINHGVVTVIWGLLGFIAGGPAWAVAAAVGYFFREVAQHMDHGTKGFVEWLDRVFDVAVPVVVAIGFAVFMGN